jgi:hypothetical protein
MFYASSLSNNSSLEHLVSYLDRRYDIQIRKQSLDERFSEKCVNFVKSVLKQLICAGFSNILFSTDFFVDYNHVRIKDSRKFTVLSNLIEHFRGNGNNTAGISIQYEFDLKTGRFLELTINEYVRNDQKDAGETVNNICENDLVIRDLGYFTVPVLGKINENKAFFLSRFLSSVEVYDENDDKLDFKCLYDKMTKHGIPHCEKHVFIGDTRLPVRLVIGVVPDEVYQQRIRRKEKEEKKKGRKMKDRTRLLQHFNLFVTNVEEDKLPIEKIMPLYRCRWQVELMFSNWKSIFSIHALQKMKEHRYITMLYIRLILIVVNIQIINHVQSLLWEQKQREAIISYKKAMATLKNSFSEILIILRSSTEQAVKELEKIYLTLSKNHWRENRKKRVNFFDILSLFMSGFEE